MLHWQATEAISRNSSISDGMSRTPKWKALCIVSKAKGNYWDRTTEAIVLASTPSSRVTFERAEILGFSPLRKGKTKSVED